jgi:hypothetical protein
MSRNRATKQFGVAVSTAVVWMQRLEETGSIAPGKMGGHKPKTFPASMRFGSRNASEKLTSHYAAWSPNSLSAG